MTDPTPMTPEEQQGRTLTHATHTGTKPPRLHRIHRRATP